MAEDRFVADQIWESATPTLGFRWLLKADGMRELQQLYLVVYGVGFTTSEMRRQWRPVPVETE